jgi:hypothetical protein
MKRPDNGKLDEPISRRGLLKIGAITTAALLVPGCAQPAPSVPAPMATSTNLLQAAKDVIKYFNSGDYASLEGGMHPHVILERIHHDASYNGLLAAKSGLDNDMEPRHPKLKKLDETDWDDRYLTLATGNSNLDGRVNGFGYYIDLDDDHTTVRKAQINFYLSFVRDKPSDGWLLIDSSARKR